MQNEMFKYKSGWITQDQACKNVTGEAKAALPEPIDMNLDTGSQGAGNSSALGLEQPARSSGNIWPDEI
jgi:hypothetical protein